MEFRTVFVVWLLVLVPYALGATKRFKRDAMDTANHNANQTLDNIQSNIQDWLKEVKSGLSAEQQKRLDTIGSSNPELLRELFELMQKHADDTNGDKFKQAAKALVEKYLNGGAGPQSDTPETPNIPNITDIPDTPAIPDLPDIPDVPNWVQEVISGFSAEQQRRLVTIASDPNFLREYRELMQKYGTDIDEFKQAVKALLEKYVNGGARPQSDTPEITNIPNITDIPDTPAIPDLSDLSDAPDWVQEIFLGFSAEQQKRLMMAMASDPNFLREYRELMQKDGNGTDELKQAVKALAERYVNGGAGLVVSLVTLVASLVVQGLMMFG